MKQSQDNSHRFQVDLRGVLDLLSNHLYSGPQVYLRELLQNAVDAIHARQQLEPSHIGEVHIEVVTQPDAPSTLLFEDDGIGLTEEEIHTFLATIGQSSKRGELLLERNEFIGQFGIGLLSCFMVSDEIVVISTSAKQDTLTCEWRGRADGTYSVRRLEKRLTPGTQVFLRGKDTEDSFVEAGKVMSLARRYGEFLPCPIFVKTNDSVTQINRPAPWDDIALKTGQASGDAIRAYGRSEFGMDFLDAFPIWSDVGQVEGIAFVLPYSSGLIENRADRVYLRNILCTEKSNELLPNWAFFARCILNVRDLSPTASRESFHESEKLESARESLGQNLRNQLMELARHAPDRLERLISMHQVAIKALAIEDDECLRLFADWLPFFTSAGLMTLGELRQKTSEIHYAATVEQFQQISPVATAQSMCLVNAGYIYDQQILERLADVYPELTIRRLSPDSLSDQFDELTLDDRDYWFDFIRVAEASLEPFECGVEVRRFAPIELPSLYASNSSGDFLRSLKQTQDVSDPFWKNVLEGVGDLTRSAAQSRLILNANNRLIQKMGELKDRVMQRRCIELIYVQSLMMGHHPLRQREMKTLNDGIVGLIDWSIDSK